MIVHRRPQNEIVLAQRVLAREKAVGRGLIDQDHASGRRRIGVAEQAPANQGNTKRAKVARRDGSHREFRPVLRLGFAAGHRERLRVAGSSGWKAVRAADSTPGRPPTRWTSPSLKRLYATKCGPAAGATGYLTGDSSNCAFSTPVTSKPGSVWLSFQKLRISRPAPVSSTTARATSATTSAERSRRPSRPLVAPRTSSARSAVWSSSRRAPATGRSPNTRPIATDTPSANSQHRAVDAHRRQSWDVCGRHPHQHAQEPEG